MRKKLFAAAFTPVLMTMVANESLQVKPENEKNKDRSRKVSSIEALQAMPQTFTIKKAEGAMTREEIDRKVRMAELLAQSPISFPHAKPVLEEVLSQDPGNDKALFYSALSDLVFSVKGVYGKGEKLFEKPSDYQAAYNSAANEWYPEYADFFFQSKGKKYETYVEGIDDILARTESAYKSAADKLSRIDEDFELIFTQLSANTSVTYACDVSDDGYSQTCTRKEEMKGIAALPSKRKKVAPVDAQVIRGYMLGMLNYSRLYSAYSLEGQKEISEEIQRKQEALGRSLTDLETNTIAKKHSNYLTLKPSNEFGEMVTTLEDMAEIALDLESMNNQFCEDEARTSYLIGQICMSPDARKEIEKTLEYLAGPKEHQLGYDAKGNPVKILVDLPGYLRNPVQDLKSLLSAVDYDEDGAGQVVREPNLNGLFPNGDYLEKAKQVVTRSRGTNQDSQN